MPWLDSELKTLLHKKRRLCKKVDFQLSERQFKQSLFCICQTPNSFIKHKSEVLLVICEIMHIETKHPSLKLTRLGKVTIVPYKQTYNVTNRQSQQDA